MMNGQPSPGIWLVGRFISTPGITRLACLLVCTEYRPPAAFRCLARTCSNSCVPVERLFDPVVLDGSVTGERISGELVVRCNREVMNFLGFSLANDIVMRNRSVEDACKF